MEDPDPSTTLRLKVTSVITEACMMKLVRQACSAFSCTCRLASFCAMQCVSLVRHFHRRRGMASDGTAESHGRACIGNPTPVVMEEGPRSWRVGRLLKVRCFCPLSLLGR